MQINVFYFQWEISGTASFSDTFFLGLNTKIPKMKFSANNIKHAIAV